MSKLSAQLDRYKFDGSTESYRIVCICDELSESLMSLAIFWMDPTRRQLLLAGQIGLSIRALELAKLAKFDLLTYTVDSTIRERY